VPLDDLNEGQRIVAESLEGIYVVDAGAGTGKTTTITERYVQILKKVSPDRILLLTFTDNAAQNMRNKIINRLSEINNDDYDVKYSARDVMNAPISTFHSFCNKLLQQYSLNVPRFLGIDENLHNYNIISDTTKTDILERRFFKRFFDGFREIYPRYEGIYKVIESQEILSLIKRLCCKGIFPHKSGWFGDGEEWIKGDFDGYVERFSKFNEPGMGKRVGAIQSQFSSSLKGKLREKLYISIPEIELFIDKQVNPAAAELAFFGDDRASLKEFIHDVYFEYIKHCVKSNHINFDFMIMFAFILLYHNHGLREKLAFDYVMVDEFQDTNEMQFILTLLLMKTNNLCVVGDWKQGIYSFRYATIDNILQFSDRISQYKDFLNSDGLRIGFDTKSEIQGFIRNYRSSQTILNFSEGSLIAPSSSSEQVDESIKKDIIHLTADYELEDRTKIEFLKAGDKTKEYGMILAKIQEIIGSEDYKIKEKTENGYEYREVRYKDIAVLCRRRAFALELQNKAMEYNIPVNYDGGVELFRTKPAVLLLAWLRLLLNMGNRDAWVPILEKEGHIFPEIDTIIRTQQYPDYLMKFRDDLVREEQNIANLIDSILGFYEFGQDNSGIFSNALVAELGRLFGNSLMSIPDLVDYIEENIRQNETYEVDINRTEDAIIIQTIHGAKGLEYPVVFIADVNYRRFPPFTSDRDLLLYHDLTGLRVKKEHGEKNGYKYIFNKWAADFLTTRLFQDPDEERRLLYVAITRAKQYLIFTASEKPSKFFEYMSDGFAVIDDYPSVPEMGEVLSAGSAEEVDAMVIDSYEKRNAVISVHDLMGYSDSESISGKSFGARLHHFAHRIALGFEDEWDAPEAEKVRNFIKSLKATELRPEVECSLPIGNVLIRGKIDLLAFCHDEIHIIDYKSDSTEAYEKKYQKQLTIYYHVLKGVYPEREIRCKLYYVRMDRIKDITPLPIDEMESLAVQLYKPSSSQTIGGNTVL
jgi:ATP-dependent helicase/nuclease subunit A